MTLAFPQVRAPSFLRPSATPGARMDSAVNPVVRVAFYLFVMSIPFEIPDRTIVPVDVPTLAGILFLLTTALNPSACFRRVPAALVWFVAYLWILALSSVVNGAEDSFEVVRLFIAMIQLLLIFWVGVNLLIDPVARRGVLLALAASCAARAAVQVLGIAATSHQVWTGGARVTAFGQNANLSAIILSAGLVAAIGLRKGLVSWALAGLMGMAIIQTGSRGGLLCAAVGLLAFLWHGSTGWARLRNAAVGLVGIGLLGWGALHSEMMRNRIEQAAEEGQFAGREQIYPALLDMFAERPVLGWGPINNQYQIARRIGEQKKVRRDAHNLVLELLTTAGVVGALPFLVGLALCVAGAWRARHGSQGALPLALLCAVLMGTISGTWIAGKILWLALAIALAAGRHHVETRPCAV